MRAIHLIIALLFVLTSCGPRQDEKDRGQNGAGGGAGVIQLGAGQIETVVEEGGQLPSSGCGPRKEGEKGLRWTTLFIRDELKPLFDKIENITVFLGKGRNCQFVSSKEAFEYTLALTPDVKPFEPNTKVFRYVTKLEAMNTSDFLADAQRIKIVSEGMGMSEEAIKAYLQSGKQFDKVSITYISKNGESGKPGDTKPGPGSGGTKPGTGGDLVVEPGQQIIAKPPKDNVGVQLPSCGSDDVWGQIRLNYDLEFMFADAPKMTHYVQAGAKNCLQAHNNKTVQLAFETEVDSKKFESQESYFKINQLQLMHADDLLADEAFLKVVADGMFIPEAKLKALAKNSKDKNITIAYLEPSEKIEAGQPGQAIETFTGPGVLKACEEAGQKWSQIRVRSNVEALFKEKIENKSIKVWLGKGDFNCLEIGSNSGFSFDLGKGSWSPETDHPIKVTSISLVPKDTIINTPFMLRGLAEDAGFVKDIGGGVMVADEEEFLKYLDTLKDQSGKINITNFDWL